MAKVDLHHHVLGQTSVIVGFAEKLREAGHIVDILDSQHEGPILPLFLRLRTGPATYHTGALILLGEWLCCPPRWARMTEAQ